MVGVATLMISALMVGACNGGSSKDPAASVTTTAAAAPAAATPSTVAATIAPTRSTAPADPGSVTVAFTQPISTASTVHTQVACAAEHGHFLAQASFPSGDTGNDFLSFSVNVPGYQGPRHYRGEVTVEILGPSGDSTKTTVSQDVAVDTATHGAFSIAATADNRRPIAGSVGWTCS